MQKTAIYFGLASITALCGAVAACSSTTTTTSAPTTEDGGSEASAPKDAGNNTKDARIDEEEEDSGAKTGDEACGDSANQKDCAQCCATNHPTGYKVLLDSLTACACDGTGVDGGAAACGTECGNNFCQDATKEPPMACDTCLTSALDQKTGACYDAVVKACTASQDCIKQNQCANSCLKLPTG